MYKKIINKDPTYFTSSKEYLSSPLKWNLPYNSNSRVVKAGKRLKNNFLQRKNMKKHNIFINWTELMETMLEEKIDFSNCLYVHCDQKNKAFYVGKATSFKTRYAGGYQHLILGCLESKRKIYIGEFKDFHEKIYGITYRPKQKQGFSYNLLNIVENDLINRLETVGNKTRSLRRELQPKLDFYSKAVLKNRGECPFL